MMRPGNPLGQAMDLLEKAERQLLAGRRALDQQATTAQGLLAAAEENADAAWRICRQHRLLPELTALHDLAVALILQQKYPQAVQILRERLRLAEQRDDIRTQQSALEELANVCLRMGDREKARHYYGRAVALFEERRDRLAAEPAQVPFAEHGAPLYERLIQVCLRQNDPTSALEAVERARSRAFLDLLSTAGEWSIPRLNTALEQSEQELLRDLREVIAASSDPDEQDVGRRAELWSRWVQLDEKLEHVWQEMNENPEYREYLAIRQARPLNYIAIQAILGWRREE
jgi:tetratricopeptide (TPR) repeat protein